MVKSLKNNHWEILQIRSRYPVQRIILTSQSVNFESKFLKKYDWKNSTSILKYDWKTSTSILKYDWENSTTILDFQLSK